MILLIKKKSGKMRGYAHRSSCAGMMGFEVAEAGAISLAGADQGPAFITASHVEGQGLSQKFRFRDYSTYSYC